MSDARRLPMISSEVGVTYNKIIIQYYFRITFHQKARFKIGLCETSPMAKDKPPLGPDSRSFVYIKNNLAIDYHIISVHDVCLEAFIKEIDFKIFEYYKRITMRCI